MKTPIPSPLWDVLTSWAEARSRYASEPRQLMSLEDMTRWCALRMEDSEKARQQIMNLLADKDWRADDITSRTGMYFVDRMQAEEWLLEWYRLIMCAQKRAKRRTQNGASFESVA